MEYMNIKENWKSFKGNKDFQVKCIVIVLLLIGIVAIVLPIIMASSMTFYRGDDFSDIGTISDGKKNIIELFMASVRNAKNLYFTWQGNYFSMFIFMFIHPILGGGLLQLRIVMIANSILFAIGLVSFSWGLCRREIASLQGRWLLVLCCFLGILGFQSWYQIFYWYTGATVYTIPISLLMIALSMILLSEKKHKYIIAGILLFCATGGNYAVAAAGCYWMLMIVISRFYKHKLKKQDIVLFIVTVAGALINCLAPGNFARHDVIDESGLHFFRAVIYGFSEVVATGERLFLDSPFIIIALIACFIGVISGRKKIVDKTYSWIMIVTASLAPIVTYFPVCLGFSSGGGPNRCQFVLTFVFVLSAMIILVLLGEIFADYIDMSYIREAVIIVLLLLIIMPIKRDGWKFSSLIPYQTMMALTKGDIQSYYHSVNRMYDDIRKDENDDVFIYEWPKSVEPEGLFLSLDMDENPTSLRNSECAYYFEKNTVQFVSEPVFKSGDTYVRIAPSYFEHDLSYVSIFIHGDTSGTEMVQVLKPFEKNMVLKIPEGETGTVSVYVFGDDKGDEIIETFEISY